MHMRWIDVLGPDTIGPEDSIVAPLLALQIIRRALADGTEGCRWRAAGDCLRLAHAQMVRQQRIGLVVGPEGALRPSRHERRLLRAIAASQLSDPGLVDTYLFSLALGRRLRPVLTVAIERLACGLSLHDHRLTLTSHRC